MKRAWLSLCTASALAFGLHTAALANGGAFFADESEDYETPKNGNIYFGDVRDITGKGVPNVTVTIATKDKKIVYQVRTDKTGKYRSSLIDTDPKATELTLSTTAYKLNKAIPLTKDLVRNAPVETDFIVEPVTASGTAKAKGA